jgi:predicted DNA binding CopG/RHH family protein
MEAKRISAAELDAKFDSGEDIEDYMDITTLRRPGLEKRRVNVDFTDHMVRKLDQEAQARGVTRQALIKMWIADRLEQAA